MIQYRFQSIAENAVFEVVEKLRSGIEDDLQKAAEAMNRCALRGGSVKEFNDEAEKIKKLRLIIRDVYLFMNPWGFIRPETESEISFEPLLEMLRKTITATPKEQPVWFSLHGKYYGFLQLTDKHDFYVGIEINMPAFSKRLLGVMDRAAGNDLVLIAKGGGINIGTGLASGAENIVITDSFLPDNSGLEEQTAFDSEFKSVMSDERPLAWGRLDKPMDSVRIMAFLKNPERTVAAAISRNRLYLWGILLLAGGIVTGVWIVFSMSADEINKIISRQDFLVGISHDLRTPLASMKALAESIFYERVADAEKKKRFLEIIISECDRLNLMTERILYLVRYGQDAISLQKDVINGVDIVIKAVDNFEKLLILPGKVGNVKITVRTPSDGNINIFADSSAVSQVVMNLLDNAVKYGKPVDGSETLIEVLVEKINRRKFSFTGPAGWLKISVADNGQGIGWVARRRIFSRFYREKKSKSSGIAGSGLGLALCRYVAKEHGGWIEARKKKEGGMVFTIYFPIVS